MRAAWAVIRCRSYPSRDLACRSARSIRSVAAGAEFPRLSLTIGAVTASASLLPGARPETYWRRVRGALTPFRLGVAVALAALLSARPLFTPNLLDFFTPFDVALAWLEHLLELLPVAFALVLAYALVDEALPPQAPLRLLAVCALLFVTATLLAVIYLGLLQGFEHLPPAVVIAAYALQFSVPAIFCVVIAEVDRRTRRIDAIALEAEAARARLEREETEQQLQVLQAQIEPHFLFNTLANVRRLYRTQPQSGAAMIASLMRYLRAALPQMRRSSATLADEVDLVCAYLELFQVRMGQRLSYSIGVDRALHALEFPPMLLLTLVENAIKHGLDPSREGGQVTVSARRRGDTLEVSVADDGVGFGVAGASGSGVGLANIRRQLSARYGGNGRLELGAQKPRGVVASIALPAATAPAAAPSAAEALR